MTVRTDSTLEGIAQAVAAYLVLNRAAVGVPFESVQATRFAVDDLAAGTKQPRIYVTGLEVSQEQDERGDRRYTYFLELQIVAYVSGDVDKQKREVSLLLERVKTVLTNVDQGGADFWSLADDQPVDEIAERELETGGYVRAMLPLEYITIQ